MALGNIRSILHQRNVYRVRFCLIDCIDKHILAQTISVWFCVLTLPISFYHIFEHLVNFRKPKLQANVVRILCMVPVFSIESTLSIHFVHYAVYFQFIRETYESYVIYCFLRYSTCKCYLTFMCQRQIPVALSWRFKEYCRSLGVEAIVYWATQDADVLFANVDGSAAVLRVYFSLSHRWVSLF